MSVGLTDWLVWPSTAFNSKSRDMAEFNKVALAGTGMFATVAWKLLSVRVNDAGISFVGKKPNPSLRSVP